MGMQINIGDHTSTEADFLAVPHNKRGMTSWARTKANTIARTMPSANVYFRSLPGGRSLTQLLADGTIWINFAPSLSASDFGVTDQVGGKEIAIGPRAYRIGRWTVLATLIHELAHSNGAPGEPSKQAEESLLHCGLGRRTEQSTGDDADTPYDPNIEG